MTDLQLFVAIGLPVSVVLASLMISLSQIVGLRDEIRKCMRELRTDLHELHSDIHELRSGK